MKDGAETIMKDWLSLLLASLGVSFWPHEFIAGLLLALAGAAVARALSPEKDQRELWLTFVLGALVAIGTAEVMSLWWKDGPLQLAMGAAGFASRWVAQFAVTLLDRASVRSTELADRVIDKVMPEDQKDPEK